MGIIGFLWDGKILINIIFRNIFHIFEKFKNYRISMYFPGNFNTFQIKKIR